ncbi:MAG: signal peptide peptidase SppA [Nannocystaceae bacterium]|nr:signal peptide peptidase SppA [Nannocystaceae bacterium]
MSRRRSAVAALGWVTLAAAPVSANPNEGATRAISRDAERPYTAVAGEGDGSSTVVNPANLGYLNAVNGVLDLGWTLQNARRRGSGVGAFVGIPLPSALRARRLSLRGPLFALGFGYQYLSPLQPDAQVSETEFPSQSDNPYSKVTVAASLPMMRWAPGLSIGLGYSRLVSVGNFHANANFLDLGISYHASRFIALGFVAHTVNVPRTGPETAVEVNVVDGVDAPRVTVSSNRYAQPLVLEPEVAIRPLGTPQVELAGGVRWAPVLPDDGPARFKTFVAEPRVRAAVQFGPVKLFAQADVMRYLPPIDDAADARAAARITAGLEFVDGNFGVAAGLLSTASGRQPFSVDGGVARLRLSAERYEGLEAAPRQVTRLQLSRYRGERGLWALVQELQRVGEQGGMALVETRGVSFGWAQAEELREAIRRARLAGARVLAYVEGDGLRSYFVASAAETIIAHPNAELSIVGMRVETFFLADLLSKLGAKAEFVRIAEYKSVPETFERTGPTPPSDRQRRLLHTDIWNHVLRVIAQDRGQDPRSVKRWIDAAPLRPQRAQRDGVVDRLAFPDELDSTLESLLGRKVRIATPPQQSFHRHDYGLRPRVAVLVIEGDLSDSKSFEIPFIERKVAGSITLTKEIERLREDKNVKAVVVRCNTPGGSVKASDDIARELDLTDAVKPVIISMSDACASGGYYVATGGRFIFADATTKTGSIGAFYPKIDISGALDKLGIEVNRISYGRHAAMRSWLKPYTDEERGAVLQSLQDGYALFTRRVGKARQMSLSRVNEVARGRVWSGVRAQRVGLVDRHGGLTDAIARALAITSLDPATIDVAFYPEEPSDVENLRRVFSFDLPLIRSGGTAFSEMAKSGGFGLSGTLLSVLRRLPVGLWLAEGPTPLAIDDAVTVIGD